MYKKIIKPLGDFIFSFVLLIISSPFFVVLFFLLALEQKGNPFFFQMRPGKNGTLFKIYKFKTMRNEYDENNNLLPDYQRITCLGGVVRKLSLDELPQLINVLKGEMSFVGPRPLLPQYLPLYNSFQKKRHNVKPGITGLAQVNGRNAIEWKKKFELDVEYVKNQSFVLDLKIILKTIEKVFLKKDINTSEKETMQPFLGNKD